MLKVLTLQTTILTCKIIQVDFKGGYSEFSHLTEFKKIYITEIYIKKKQSKSSITKRNRIK